jgi:hypothetical protein
MSAEKELSDHCRCFHFVASTQWTKNIHLNYFQQMARFYNDDTTANQKIYKKLPNFSKNSPKSCQVKKAKIYATKLNLKI